MYSHKQSHYQTLGLQYGATKEDIKKSYHSLAKINHPDKGGSEEKFKEITTAYNELTKDNDGTGGMDEMGGMGGMGGMTDSDNEIFNMMGNLANSFKHFIIGATILTVETQLELTLEQLETGGTYKVKYKRYVPSGKVNYMTVLTPMGTVRTSVPEEIELMFETDVTVPRCCNTKIPIVYKGLAVTPGYNTTGGNLEVTIITKKHPVYRRLYNDKLDLYTELHINIKEALTGFEKYITPLNKANPVKIESNIVVNPYDTKRIKKYGMCKDSNNVGDLVVKFIISFPLLLSVETIKTLKGCNLETSL